MCLTYQNPLLLDRSRGWAPKNHLWATENPRSRQPANDRALTTIVPADIYRFEGEDGSEAPVPVRDMTAISFGNTDGQRSVVP